MDLYCFDFHGHYLGHVDEEGTFFDRHGKRQARISGGGTLYDFGGRYAGRVDVQGSIFAEDGTCRGYVRGWTGLHGAFPTTNSEMGRSATP